MEKNNLIYGVMGVVIGIILLGSFMIPILANSCDSMKTTFTNGPGGYIQDGNDDYIFETAPSYGDYKINGEIVDVTYWGGNWSICFTDQCRAISSGHWVVVRSVDNSLTWNYSAAQHLMTFQYTAETKTLVCTAYNDTTKESGVLKQVSFEVANIIYRIPGGNYTEIDTTTTDGYYVNSVNQIIAGGAYTTGTLTTQYFSQGLDTWLGVKDYVGSATVSSESVAGYGDLFDCSDYTVSISNGTITESFEPFSVFVPAKVTAYTTELISIDGLISVIPFIIITAIVAGIVAVVYRSKTL